MRFICGCQCASLLAIPGAVCNLFISGDAQAPARAATVTTCDLAAALNDRTVETSFPACLASALKQINRDYLRLRRAVWRHSSAIYPDAVPMNDHRQKSALPESNRERCTKHAKKGAKHTPLKSTIKFDIA